MGFHWKVLDILYFPLLHDFGMHLEFLQNFHPIYLHVYNCIPFFKKNLLVFQANVFDKDQCNLFEDALSYFRLQNQLFFLSNFYLFLYVL